MDKKRIILLSKDALRKSALPVYGNTYFQTPNIDAIASQGTVYHRYYTAGGSTAMAFTAMATGKYLFETDRKLYDGTETSGNGQTVFDELYQAGYDVHIAWDKSYDIFAKTHFRCEGEHTKVHVLNYIIPVLDSHKSGAFDDLTFQPEETEKGLALVENLFREIGAIEQNTFLWLHLPHVFRGRNAYDSDIDVFDEIVGIARRYFRDEELYISADHGQMNGAKGKFSYGYDVEDNVMQIPLIGPKSDFGTDCDIPISNTQLAELFGLRPFRQQEFIYCETAYYAQPYRKMAIVRGDYKLVYDKHKKQFSLYDTAWDKEENLNLYYPEFYDTDRHVWYSLNQRFYYPRWEEAFRAREALMEAYRKAWKNGTFIEEARQKAIAKAKQIVTRCFMKKPKEIRNIGK